MSSTNTHTNLRANTWPVDQDALDLTASALVEGVYFEVLTLTELSPPVVSSSPPLVVLDADRDYAWDLETTPTRLHDFLTNLAVQHPTIPPSAVLETYFLVLAMFHSTWDQPAVIRGLNQEMELLFFRAFWNVALTYNQDLTEENFQALTDSRYVRSLDPSINLIMTETMVLDASRAERQNLGSWRKTLCEVFADWIVKVEVAHPHDPTTCFSFWVCKAVAAEDLPSDLGSLVAVEEMHEEALAAELEIEKESKAEVVDLSTSTSSRAITDNPPSTTSSSPIMTTATNAILQTQLSEDMTGLRTSGDQFEKSGNVEVEAGVLTAPSLLPTRLHVRTRPPFGSQSTNNSEASVVATDGAVSHEVQTAETSSSLVSGGNLLSAFAGSNGSIGKHQSAFSSTSASTSFGRFSSFRFSSKRSAASGSTLASTAATSIATTIGSSGSSRRARKSFRRSGLANVGFHSDASSESQEDNRTTPLEVAASEESSGSAIVTLAYTDAFHSSTSSSSTSKFGPFLRGLVGRHPRGTKSDTNQKSHDVSWSPPFLMDGSEDRSTMGVETVIHRSVHEVTDWDGKPMKQRGPWGQLMMIPKLYWDLYMAERRGEA